MSLNMTNKEIVDAIHKDLPIEEVAIDESTPDKMKFGDDFANMFSSMQLPKGVLTPSSKEIMQMQYIVETTTSIRTLIYELRLHLAGPLAFCAGKFLQKSERLAGKDRSTRIAYDQFKAELWNRLKRVNPQMIQWIKNKNPGFASEMLHIEALHEIIAGGINNVAFTIGAALLAIPEVYKRDHGEIITPEVWEQIGRSVLPFSKTLASSQMEVFDYGIGIALIRKGRKPLGPALNETNFDLSGFNSSALCINAKSELCLHSSIIEPTRARLIKLIDTGHIKIIEERGGCPGRPIFPLVHARYMNGTKEGLFPFAEHILSLPPE